MARLLLVCAFSNPVGAFTRLVHSGKVVLQEICRWLIGIYFQQFYLPYSLQPGCGIGLAQGYFLNERIVQVIDLTLPGIYIYDVGPICDVHLQIFRRTQRRFEYYRGTFDVVEMLGIRIGIVRLIEIG